MFGNSTIKPRENYNTINNTLEHMCAPTSPGNRFGTLDLRFRINYAVSMGQESPISPGFQANEKDLLETIILITLEEHDGFCLDNKPEREALAVAIATVLRVVLKEDIIDPTIH